MRTKDARSELTSRKAFVWKEEAPPRLADLLAGGDARRRFLRYWVGDTLRDLPKIVSYYGLKLCPPAVASELGAFHYAMIRRFYPGRNRRLTANAARIRPDLDPQAVARRNWRNKGRLMAEFSVLARLKPGREIAIEGAENLAAARAEGPVILLAMHLGNWELIAPVLRHLAVPFATFYMPPESRFEHRTACRIREDLGAVLLAPGVQGARPALKRLAERDGAVGIFGDEGFDGRIMAPFFGRPPHLSGNLAIAVRLTRHAGARIVPVHVLRDKGARFTCRFLEPITLPPAENPGDTLAADVERLNAVIEPIIARHIEQWYFLDNRL